MLLDILKGGKTALCDLKDPALAPGLFLASYPPQATIKSYMGPVMTISRGRVNCGQGQHAVRM